ncbi:MAG: hypothetical protein LWX07_09015 [Bacteroidetes bacterium]|nr:hypothetical protein [Bacteroidota bacterium]
MTLHKTLVTYLLVFSFLLSGCYTTEYYSDTPRNFLSGKQAVKPEDDYKIDSLILNNHIVLNVTDYYSRFIDYKCDTCGKLVCKDYVPYRDRKRNIDSVNELVFKTFSNDTIISARDISRFYYYQRSFNYSVTTLIILGGAAVTALLLFIGFLTSMPKHGFGK